MAEHLHFREAASVLRMSQPALSGAVAALEDALGTQLLERTTRKVLLTPAGERVARRAAVVMAELDRLAEEAAAERGPLGGPLRLGVIPTVAPYLLPVVLPELQREFPQMELAVREEQTAFCVAELIAGRVDVAVVALPVTTPGLVELPLYEEDFLLAAPEGYEVDEPVGRDALGEFDVLLLNEGHCLRDQALEVCREVGARAAAATYATSLTTLVQLVTGGLGVTLLPESAVPAETAREGMTVRRFEAPAPQRSIGLVHRATSPRAPEFALLAKVIRGAVRAREWNVRVAG